VKEEVLQKGLTENEDKEVDRQPATMRESYKNCELGAEPRQVGNQSACNNVISMFE
jgi:hypothetical protein